MELNGKGVGRGGGIEQPEIYFEINFLHPLPLSKTHTHSLSHSVWAMVAKVTYICSSWTTYQAKDEGEDLCRRKMKNNFYFTRAAKSYC